MKPTRLLVLFTALAVFSVMYSQDGADTVDQRTNPVEYTPESVQRGEAVFMEYCAGCHGKRADGRGPQALNLIPKPKNLRNRFFTDDLSDERLYSSISGGVRGTSMPAFELVCTPQERWDLLNYIRHLGEDYELEIPHAISTDKLEEGVTNPIPLTPHSTGQGKRIFELYCQSCHGENLDGRGKVSESLNPKPRNLAVIISWGEIPYLDYLEDSRIFNSISNGIPGTSMGPWNRVLTADERWHVINYMRQKATERITDISQSYTE
jgi:mono/diheme cytochrome c family protein